MILKLFANAEALIDTLGMSRVNIQTNVRKRMERQEQSKEFCIPC